MLSSNSFFKNFSFEKKVFNKNINQTKKIFKSFQIDLENFEIPMLESYYKSYNFDFSQEVIKKFSNETQFIIVTHNKLTMTESNYLYGVTQQEPGISKIISAKIN